MQPNNIRYEFRPATRADLPLLRRWLETPHVRRWWGDPEREEALLRADLEDPRITMCVVELVGEPLGYIQDYDVSMWPDEHFASLPPGTRCIDVFIGEAAFVAKGHGSALLRQRALELIAGGAPAVAIDPEVANAPARRAYEKAGFETRGAFTLKDGEFALMVFKG